MPIWVLANTHGIRKFHDIHHSWSVAGCKASPGLDPWAGVSTESPSWSSIDPSIFVSSLLVSNMNVLYDSRYFQYYVVHARL